MMLLNLFLAILLSFISENLEEDEVKVNEENDTNTNNENDEIVEE